VDDFGSSDDITMHTFGGATWSAETPGGQVFDGKPTRTAGAKRREAEAARS